MPILFLRHTNFLSRVFNLLQYFCQSKQAPPFQARSCESLLLAWLTKQSLMRNLVYTARDLLTAWALCWASSTTEGETDTHTHTQRDRLHLTSLESEQKTSVFLPLLTLPKVPLLHLPAHPLPIFILISE